MNGLEEGVVRILAASEASAEEYDPLKNFVAALAKLINLGVIKISPQKLAAGQLVSWDGFEDNEFFYLLEDRMYSKVRDNLGGSLMPFYLSLKDTKSMLAKIDLLVTCPNGKGKWTYSARINIHGSNKKMDFLKLRKGVMQEILQESGDKKENKI